MTFPYASLKNEDWPVGSCFNFSAEGQLRIGTLVEHADGSLTTSYSWHPLGNIWGYLDDQSIGYVRPPMRVDWWVPPPIPEDPTCALEVIHENRWVKASTLAPPKLITVGFEDFLTLAQPLAGPAVVVFLAVLLARWWRKRKGVK
jgi:hypothetical protein